MYNNFDGKRCAGVFNWDFFNKIIRNRLHFGWKRFAILIGLSILDVLFFIILLLLNRVHLMYCECCFLPLFFCGNFCTGMATYTFYVYIYNYIQLKHLFVQVLLGRDSSPSTRSMPVPTTCPRPTPGKKYIKSFINSLYSWGEYFKMIHLLFFQLQSDWHSSLWTLWQTLR